MMRLPRADRKPYILRFFGIAPLAVNRIERPVAAV
jgi:hypothetical protein